MSAPASPSKTAPVARPLIAAKERGPGPGRYALPTTLGSTFMMSKSLMSQDLLHTMQRRRSSPPSPSAQVSIALIVFNLFVNRHYCCGLDDFLTPQSYRIASFGKPMDLALATLFKPKCLAMGVMELLRIPWEPARRTSKRFEVHLFGPYSQPETPAPGAYKPEGVKPLKEARAPAYSMGARTDIRGSDVTPAPTTYNLGNTVGSKTATLVTNPAHSMGGRTSKGSISMPPKSYVQEDSPMIWRRPLDPESTPPPWRESKSASPHIRSKAAPMFPQVIF
jgi:hypothetical protein